MGWVFTFLAVAIVLVLVHLLRREKRLSAERLKTLSEGLNHKLASLSEANERLVKDNLSLQRFKEVRDASAAAARLREEAAKHVESASREADEIRRVAQLEADKIRSGARSDAAESRRRADTIIEDANARAASLVSDAEARAKEIAGDAYTALQDADRLAQAAAAMKNVVDGYGDRFLKPTYSLLDQLADDYGFDEAGRELKRARANTKSMVESGRAADCEYVEKLRRDTAIRFVIDAFNGKVDTILGRVKADNFGTLEQQVRDAFALVNHNGAAFRGARITKDYLASRLEELRWAASVVALREKEREEQRRIREQIREEEKARREIERAIRDAAKEEEALQKALAKVEGQHARAREDQKSAYEAQLAQLRMRLVEAEAKNQRALSMAQQTRSGHVYVISNVGSFGDQVYKVGMTRRLEPLDRIRELGDASVPFPFDVHAMIWSDDAPALEHLLHKTFLASQVNKVNPRKEFFRVSLGELKQAIEGQGVKANWTMVAEASQYRETLAIERALAERTDVAKQWVRDQLRVSEEELLADEVDT